MKQQPNHPHGSLEAGAPNAAQENARSDERTVRGAAPEVRGDMASQDAERTQENGLIFSEAEFDRLLNEEFDQTALPKPPAMPGWHLCWLTTTSSYDTIQKRMRLGYQPVRTSEVPGFDPSNGKALANYEGVVSCNEMVLFKIREELYQRMMVHFHHKQPLHEEADIVQKAQAQAEEHAERAGKPVELGAGFTDLEESVRRGQRTVPTFTST